MKSLHIAIAVAVSATLATAQSQASKHPSKAELALQTPPVTNVFPPSPMGFGSDDCALAATMDAISGFGNFAVDTTAATNSAVPFPACTTQITKDVWYQYTATATGSARVQLCGNTTADTVVAIWAGAGCPAATSLACNDDSCGLVSSLVFPTTAGSIYMIQVGMYGTTPGVLTSMDISNVVTPTNDSCSTPIALPAGNGLIAFDSSNATTGLEGQGEAACVDYGTAAVGKDIWYTWTPTMGGLVEITTCGLMTSPSANADTKIAVYDGAGCPTSAALACNDDSGHSPSSPTYTCTAGNFNSTLTFNAVCGNTYTIQIGQYPGNTGNNVGSFQITQGGTPCAPPAVAFCVGDGTGAPCPCGNTGTAGRGCGSSAFPGGALLSVTGAAGPLPATDTVVLTASNIPGPGLFFQSNGLTASPINFGDGHLCAAVGIIRLGVVFPTSGSASYPGGLTPNPISIAGGVSAGNVKHYQCWYRSVPGLCGPNNYDLTQGLTITWQ